MFSGSQVIIVENKSALCLQSTLDDCCLIKFILLELKWDRFRINPLRGANTGPCTESENKHI